MLRFKNRKALEPQATEIGGQLWQRIRHAEEYCALNDPHGEETLTLGELSEAVRQTLDEDGARHTQNANQSFSQSHARLMEVVAASRARRQRRFAWPEFYRAARLQAVPIALAGLLAMATGLGGHQLGRHQAQLHEAEHRFPIQTIVDDFDYSIHDPHPLELVSNDSHTAAAWLSHSLGIKIRMPATERAGVHLLGASNSLHSRHPILAQHAVAQTHYDKDGVRVALYQVRAPRMGLNKNDLNEVNINGKAFFTHSSGRYRAVVWRSGDDVMAMVSPLDLPQSLRLASLMRETSNGIA